MKYSMNGVFRVAYVLIGLVLIGVTAFMWMAGGWNLPVGNPMHTACLVAAAAVFALGVLLALRPLRACIKLEDSGTLFYADGWLPGRRYGMDRIDRVISKGGRRVILVFEDGRTIGIEFFFDGLQIFLAEMRARGIEVVERAR